MAKKKMQTKNGFPILVDKKPKPKKLDPIKFKIDQLPRYKIIKEAESNKDYKLDKINKEEAPVSKYQHIYDADIYSSVYHMVSFAPPAHKVGTHIHPSAPKYERAQRAQRTQVVNLPHKNMIKDNSTYGLFTKTNLFVKAGEEDLIKSIKMRKDFNDLFGPLKKTKVQIFREQISKVFPDYDTAKVGSKIIATLKNYAYLKSMKGTDRKYIPDGDELALIIDVSYIYDIAKAREQEPITVLNMLQVGILRNSRKVTELGKLLEQIEDLLHSVEYQSLDSGIMDEFNHYDIIIKFLRLLTEPKLDSLIENILKEFDNKHRFEFVDGKSDYEIGMFYINMVKKLGLRYISSRSNIEWLFYGSTLKKIRNFMSKDMYRAFVKVINQNLETYKQNEWDGLEFTKESNLWYMEKSLKVIDKLREKKFKQNIKKV